MIRIGDFARLANVSTVTLRHYDDIGLLHPVTVDRETGYRYYSVSQLPRLHRILALKDLGFSLEQIEHVLNGGVTPNELRGMLMLKRAEAEQQIADEQGRLARIEARLRYIELEQTMPTQDVVLKTLPAAIIASCLTTIPTNDQVPEYLDRAYADLWAHIKATGAKVVGPHMAIWHQGADVLENEQAEAAVAIERAVPSSDTVKVSEQPPIQVAALVHRGSFDTFVVTHTALLKWIEDNGYRSNGTYREVYIQFDPSKPDESVAEVQYPVEKA